MNIDREHGVILHVDHIFADEPLVIETNLTADEKADIKEGRKLRRDHPEEFISLDHYLKHGVS